ncbi:hypothetical protein [Streptomyces sp. bgisy060]|uniref:hypothetical protein n=1 Tax=Streptomyces sp. bgisy060 TaxID=3413775 RepID=UPI003EBA9D43
MSTPPESPSARRLVRDATGLLLAGTGALLVLAALGCIHPLLSTSVATAGALSASHFLLRPRGQRSRIIGWALAAVTSASGVVTAFLCFPPLAWVEIGAAAIAAGAWLASEGA